MQEAKREELLKAGRRYLAITWEDPEMDALLGMWLEQGATYLEGLAFGAPLDYEAGSLEFSLLMEYLLFAQNGLLNEFSTHCERDLNTFQLYYGGGGDT